MKRISSKYILNALTSSEFGFKGINENDVYDFIGDAVQLLGFGLFQDIVYKQASVEFYKIPYPCDVIDVLNVYYKGHILSRKNCKVNETYEPFGWLKTEMVNKTNLLLIRDKITSLEEQSLEELEDRELLLRDIVKSFDIVTEYNKVPVNDGEWVNFRENTIETSLENGVVYLEATTFAVDELGLPFIYDEIKYLTAIKYYCACMLVQGGYQHPTLQYRDLITLKDDWLAKARNQERRFSFEQAEDFKSNWTNILKNSSDKYQYRM